MNGIPDITVKELAPADPQVLALIAAHAAYCREHTPTGSGHALEGDTPDLAQLRYWVALAGNEAIGCIGLKPLEPRHGEIKTLHVLASARRTGVGGRLLAHLIDEATKSGLRRLSLETGSSEGFAASRYLYEDFGFSPCDAFGPYADDPFSVCMTRKIRAG